MCGVHCTSQIINSEIKFQNRGKYFDGHIRKVMMVHNSPSSPDLFWDQSHV